MSSFIIKKIILPIIIVIGVTFLFIYFMFESLGIGEYVWPVLIPIFGWTFGLIAVIFIIIGVACKVGGGIPSDQAMVRRTYSQQTYPTYDSPSVGAVYVVPVYCPNCMNKLELDRVEWIGSSDLTCPNCLSAIQAGVRENF